jgi:hypothetical protein
VRGDRRLDSFDRSRRGRGRRDRHVETVLSRVESQHCQLHTARELRGNDQRDPQAWRGLSPCHLEDMS